MLMRTLFAILAPICLLMPAEVQAESRPVVAVFDVQPKFLKLTRPKQDMLTDLLGQSLGVGGVFQVMPPGDVKRTLMEQSSASYKSCFDEKCQIELGRQLPANKLVTTTITKVAGQCRVASSLYDLKRQTTDLVTMEKGGCTEKALVDAIEKVAAKLREWAGGVSDVELPKEGPGDSGSVADSGSKEYTRALNKAWRKLAREVRRGTTEQKLEKYQAFLADYPADNPFQAKVQKAIDSLEARLAKQEEAKRKAAEKKAALEAKRERARKMKAAFNQAKSTMGSPADKQAVWEKFVADYPADNPYLKTARRKITSLKALAAKQARMVGVADPATIQWVFSRPARIDFTKTEVTVAQYQACVQAGKCSVPITGGACNWGKEGMAAHPVDCVDWNQATAFCRWAGGRLPTEQEWEAEASAGGKRQYPWGDQAPSCDLAVWKQGGSNGCGKKSDWAVCSKPRGNSVSGLCDMSGNVREWTSSLFEKDSPARALRGGSWSGEGGPKDLSASNRIRYLPKSQNGSVGMRCVRAPAVQEEIKKTSSTGAKPRPRLVDVFPDRGPPKKWITITGRNLDRVQKVWLAHRSSGRVELMVKHTSKTEIKVFVPAGCKGGALEIQAYSKRKTTSFAYTVPSKYR